jgi:hypothetical protein
MLTAGMNDLAMRAFAFHGGRGGDGFALVLMGVVAAGVLVWALSRSGNNQSAKS